MKELPLNLEKGDVIEIEGVDHVFERIDPDGRITFASLRQRVEYMVTDPSTGFPVKPTADDVAALMIERKFIKRAKDLQEGPRRAARKRELDAAAVRTIDPKAEFKVVFIRSVDADPCSLSDSALVARNAELLKDPKVAALPGARLYAGSTLRGWVNTRGRPGDRRMRDGLSMTGRKSGRRVHHPKEILLHWVAVGAGLKTTARPHAKAKARKAWEDYKGELARINKGEPTGREEANYPKPATPYEGVSYTTFWRIVRDVRSSATLKAQHGSQAVYAAFGGGGWTEMPSRVGALAMMDDTPVPGIFLIDEVNRIPLGQATLTLLMESVSRVILGWVLGWEEASSATVLRTYEMANTPKAIPRDLDELHPELKWLCCKPTELLVDNLTAHHGRHVEDSLLDAGTDVHFAGSEMPRDKAGIESLIGTIQNLAIKDYAGATYDIPRAREYGFIPDEMIMVPLKAAQTLLLRAICTYHLSPHAGLNKKQPALVFKQHALAHGVSIIDDIDQFHRSIGIVEYEVQLRPSGVIVNRLRYSHHRTTRELIDDLVALQPPSASKTKKISLTVKVKYSPDDLGEVHVWNARTQQYVTLPCDRPDYASGMPLWAHNRVLEQAKHEADEYSCVEEYIEIRKRLFEAVRNISSEASDRDKRTLAKLKDDPLFQRVIGEIVEVVDEPVDLVQPTDAPDFFVTDGLAAPHRADATIPTPRPKTRKPRGAAARASRDSRDAGTQSHPSSPKPVVKKPSASASNLKWGAVYD